MTTDRTIALIVVGLIMAHAIAAAIMRPRPGPRAWAMRCDAKGCGRALTDHDVKHTPGYVLGWCAACDKWSAIDADIAYRTRSAFPVMLAYFLGGAIAGAVRGHRPTEDPKAGPIRSGPPDGVPWPNAPSTSPSDYT